MVLLQRTGVDELPRVLRGADSSLLLSFFMQKHPFGGDGQVSNGLPR